MKVAEFAATGVESSNPSVAQAACDLLRGISRVVRAPGLLASDG